MLGAISGIFLLYFWLNVKPTQITTPAIQKIFPLNYVFNVKFNNGEEGIKLEEGYNGLA